MTSTTDLIDAEIWSLSLDDKMKVWDLIEQLVKEKTSTLYTEEQMINAFKYAYLIGEDNISEDDAELEAKEYIQSLKQPKKD